MLDAFVDYFFNNLHYYTVLFTSVARCTVCKLNVISYRIMIRLSWQSKLALHSNSEQVSVVILLDLQRATLVSENKTRVLIRNLCVCICCELIHWCLHAALK
jgi:hypothetical protein